jgi:hypothetical protein
MRKSGKIILGSVVTTVVAIAIMAFIVVFTNLNRVVKYGVETYGPSATGTPVSLANARVSIRSGKGELNGLVIGNPKGFASDYALKLDKIKVRLDPQSLTEDIIVVERLIVDSATVNSEFKGIQNNLQQIRSNLRRHTGTIKAAEKEQEQHSAGEEKVRFLVKEFYFTHGEVTLLSDVAKVKQTMEIPSFTLTNIGESTQGATLGEIFQQLLWPMLNNALASTQTEGLKMGTKQIKERTKEKLDELDEL